MSWQAYVDTNLVGSGTVDKAAIYDVTGRGAWATSAGFSPKPEELSNIVAILNEGGKGAATDGAFANGFHLEGQRYVAFKIEDRSLYGRADKEGILIVKTKQALLIAHQPKEVVIQQTAAVVEGLADYLINLGY